MVIMASGSDSDVKMLYLSQAANDVAEREFVLKLIGLYREHPVLWNSSNEHYTNKYRRIVALKKICDTLKQYKPHYTIEEVKKKMNILRTNFNKEKNKMEKRKSIAPDEELEPILWYYNEMSFLTGQDVATKRKSSIANEVPTPNRIMRNMKRKKISIISESSSGFKRLESEEEILAKCWAMKLRKLSTDQRLFAEKIINDTLFEAELGTLTRHGASFNYAAPAVWTEYTAESHSPPYKSPSAQS